ncbi:hypothetical protein AB0L86_24960 [Micromonospora musae]|uniref:hypothetical protein n=1 Tax=Micromonospora musae TaxID=1894970 RepID=UPI00343646A0
MSFINRMVDRLLGGFAPRVTAAAACQADNRYCYCSGGIAYRHICQICYNADGSTTVACGSQCTPSGTC